MRARVCMCICECVDGGCCDGRKQPAKQGGDSGSECKWHTHIIPPSHLSLTLHQTTQPSQPITPPPPPLSHPQPPTPKTALEITYVGGDATYERLLKVCGRTYDFVDVGPRCVGVWGSCGGLVGIFGVLGLRGFGGVWVCTLAYTQAASASLSFIHDIIRPHLFVCLRSLPFRYARKIWAASNGQRALATKK